jgi:hypothetical protein
MARSRCCGHLGRQFQLAADSVQLAPVLKEEAPDLRPGLLRSEEGTERLGVHPAAGREVEATWKQMAPFDLSNTARIYVVVGGNAVLEFAAQDATPNRNRILHRQPTTRPSVRIRTARDSCWLDSHLRPGFGQIHFCLDIEQF